MFSTFLNSTNSPITVGPYNGSTVTAGGNASIPLGTVGSSATGEGFVKVGIVAGANGQFSGTTAFAAPTGGTTSITAMTVNAGQVGFVQNLAALPLYLKFGTTAATNSFSMILKASATALDGTGGYVYINDRTGPVSLLPQSGTSSFIAWVSN